jgi:cold shock protein
MSDEERHRGRIVRFMGRKHFGFIRPDSGGKHCFFHVSDLVSDAEPANGDVVTYELSTYCHGRTKAIEINLFSGDAHERT